MFRAAEVGGAISGGCDATTAVYTEKAEGRGRGLKIAGLMTSWVRGGGNTVGWTGSRS